jgi:hypothetical protein
VRQARGRATSIRALRGMRELPEPTEHRVLDFESASRELAALTDRWVGIELSQLAGSGAFLTLVGRLDRSWTLGSSPKRAHALVIDKASVRIPESALARVVLERYRDARKGLEWRLVAIELRIGILVEVEEIPAGRNRSPGLPASASALSGSARAFFLR